jgi:hypothetical protein
LVLLHSSLLLVVVVQVTVLALAFGIDKPVGVRACSSVTVSSILVVAMVAHTLLMSTSWCTYLSVVFLVLVGALHDFHGFSL